MTATARIAFVSDIHGNLPALEAVLEELERHEPFDRVVGGGDYAAGGAFPRQCLERLPVTGWDFVRGNADEWVVEIATNNRVPARGYVAEVVPNAQTRESMAWTADQLTDDQVEMLAGLPIDWSITGPSGKKLVFVHATPSSTHIGFPPDAPLDVVLPMFAETGADVLLHGHIHHAYIREVDGGTIGCVGSVGMPFDRDPRPCILIATDDGTGWRVAHHRVTYDIEAYITYLLESTMPHAEEYARRVRTAEK
jgi:predicted phosphodiesterase